jgi:hypothetical protein
VVSAGIYLILDRDDYGSDISIRDLLMSVGQGRDPSDGTEHKLSEFCFVSNESVRRSMGSFSVSFDLADEAAYTKRAMICSPRMRM